MEKDETTGTAALATPAIARPYHASPDTAEKLAGLTLRELDVLHSIMRGDRDHEIADQLSLTLATVRRCGASLREKLGARSRTELAVRAVEAGVIVEMRQRRR